MTPVQGDRIVSIATLRYDGGSTVANHIINVVVPAAATITFLKDTRGQSTSVGQSQSSGSYNVGTTHCGALSPDLDRLGSVFKEGLILPGTRDLIQGELFSSGEMLYIRVDDADQNLDSAQIDSVEVLLEAPDTGDFETLTINETSANSGVFVGYMVSQSASSSPGDCALAVVADKEVRATYTDQDDASDQVASSALVDPLGLVFNSVSGAPIDGVTVTLVDAKSGQPASVYSDDGVTPYPASVVSGQTVSDSAGHLYPMASGRFRFPFVRAGDYLLQLGVPNGYAFPSKATDAALAALPGGPYAITVGSRGEPFTVPVGPALRIDIPLDPKLTNLFVVKESSKRQAAIGDFVEYRVTVENPTIAAASPVELIDQLPVGLRYVKGTLLLDDGSRPEPQISSDGRRLTIALGTLATGATRHLRYSVEVAAGTQLGKNVNSAFATTAGAPASNTANASVEVIEDLQRTHAHLLGRVMVGNCAPEPPAEGEMRLHLTSAAADEAIHYRAAMALEKVDAERLRLRVDLPPVMVYRPGSAQLDGNPLPDPRGTAHQLIFDLGPRPAEWRGQLTFATDTQNGQAGDYLTRATLLLDRGEIHDIATPDAEVRFSDLRIRLHPRFATLSAELDPADQQAIRTLGKRLSRLPVTELELVGHTDDRGIAPNHRHLFRDNLALSEARARSVAEAFQAVLDLKPEQVQVRGAGEGQPVADNQSEAGRAENRRVELRVALAGHNGGRYLLTQSDSGVQRMRLMGDPGAATAPVEGRRLEGVEGVRLYLEDGRFADSDAQGLFHFEGVKAGSHVVQLDSDSLPPGYAVVDCVEDPRYAGSPDSLMVDVQGGGVWRTDFHLRRLNASLGRLGLRLDHEQQGNILNYRATVSVSERPLSNARVMVRLPKGQRYRPGSSRLDGATIADPENVFGRLLFPIKPGESHTWEMEIRFQATLDERAAGEQESSAQIYYDLGEEKNQRSLEVHNRLYVEPAVEQNYAITTHFASLSATLTDADRAALDRVIDELRRRPLKRIQVFGHTDDLPVPPGAPFADNQALSRARAEAVADYLMAKLALDEHQVEVQGLGDAQPLTPGKDRSARAQNRRVELRVESHARTRLLALERDSGMRTEIHPIPPPGSELDKGPTAAQKVTPGVQSLHQDDRVPLRIGALRLALNPRLKYTLTIDGQVIDDERIGFRMFDDASGLNIVSYIGVDFGLPGEHLLRLTGSDNFNVVRFKEEIHYTRTGQISALRLADASGNIADGTTPVHLRVELLDAAGGVIAAGAALELRGGDLRPYIPPEQVQLDPTLQRAEDKVQVDADGQMRFMPVNASGLYAVKVAVGEKEYTLRTYVKPALREEWLMVGIAEGSVAHRTLSGNLQALDAVGEQEGIYRDGRLAFYAKGRVRGDWLLTLAYDSERDPDSEEQALFQSIDPDRYYTLYGDTSEQHYDAPSSERLYLRLEADQFNLLFGDFDSGLTVTELSRYSRSLTGLRLQYEGDTSSLSAFASDTNQAFVRDEIRGDGTSGLYHLSRQGIRLNSEKVTIETRNRLHSEVVESRRSLTRNVDYVIDPIDGTLYFKEPIYSRDDALNPVWIVVEYERVASGERALTLGGRGVLKLADDKLLLGATLVSEEADGGEGRMGGLDLDYSLSDNTRLRAELASSERDDSSGNSKGNAWLAELSHLDSTREGRLYARRVDPDYGLGQTSGAEVGSEKVGAELEMTVREGLRLTLEASRQENLDTQAVRHLGSSEVTYDTDRYLVGLGLTLVRDRYSNGQEQNADLVTARATRRLFEDKVVLRASGEQAIGERANDDYPSRLVLGVDYHAGVDTVLFAETELSESDDSRYTLNRVGLTTSPWAQAHVTSSVASEQNEYGPRTYATLGLAQGFTLSPNLSLDLGLDHSHTLNDGTHLSLDPTQVSTTDFTAVTTGLTYREELWSGNLRAEQRVAEAERKRGYFIGFYRQQSPGLGLSSTLESYTTQSTAGGRDSSQELNLSFAWRPVTSRWIHLDRLTLYRDESRTSLGEESLSHKLVNNLNSNYLYGTRDQLALQHGYKRVLDQLAIGEVVAITQLVGLEYRHAFNARWDMGLRSSTLFSQGAQAYSVGADVGLSPGRNLWLSLGYNLRGYRDEDLTAAGYTARGPYLKLRLSLDRRSSRDFMAWWERE